MTLSIEIKIITRNDIINENDFSLSNLLFLLNPHFRTFILIYLTKMIYPFYYFKISVLRTRNMEPR